MPLTPIAGRVPVVERGRSVFSEAVWRISGTFPNGLKQLPAYLDHKGEWREIGSIGAGTLIDFPTEAAALAFARECAEREAGVTLGVHPACKSDPRENF
jgi:hypothetical protein